MELWQRVGTFLLLVGFLLVVIFVLSDISHSVDFGYLFYGGLCLAGGFFLRWSHPKPPPEHNPRFRILREMKEKKAKPKGQGKKEVNDGK
jgi:hypothetical protein